MKNLITILITGFAMMMAFGSFATLSAQDAQIQIIHNSADPASASVDIYVNDLNTPFLSEFEFRDATPFVDLDPTTTYDITVTPTGADPADGITFSGIELEAGESYYVVASGVLDPGDFAENPDEVDTSFFLDIIANARTAADSGEDVDFLVYHGATDAPSVDVRARFVGGLVSDLSYTDAIEDYLTVPAGAYTLDISPAGTFVTVASFEADLSGLGGGAAIVLASGFLDPAANQDGEEFTLIAALPDGTVVEFPAAEVDPALVQIIHNSADPAFSNVDVYVNDTSGEPLFPEFGFREATEFLELDPTEFYNVVLTLPGDDPNDAGIAFEGLSFAPGEVYYVIANGVSDPADFAENPNGIDTAFDLQIISGGKTAADSEIDVEFIAFHGASDAPAVDVIARDVATLESGLAYLDSSDEFITVPADSYILDINVAGTETTAASFEADLSGLGGGTAIVLASGFLSPADNQDGPAFGLIAVLGDGTVVTLPAETPEPARVQIIHNSADPAVAEVDIFVNDTEEPALAGVPFRSATEFLEFDPTLSYTIVVSPAGAGAEAGFEFSGVEFEAGENYYVVATGVADPDGFAANPDGIETGFFLDVIAGAELEGENPDNVDFLIYHGATDAPAVDVIARDVATLGENVAYTDVSEDYISVPAASYVLDINVAGTETTAASFEADLSGLGGGTAIVLASGFLNPADNQDGLAFGLIAVLGDGTVVTLPPFVDLSASVQIIHNSADVNASSVDIYVNDLTEPFIDNFTYRSATGFVELDANVSYDITVVPAGIDPANGITFEGVTFEGGENYYVIATGLLDTESNAPNPDGISTEFFLDVIEGAKLAANDEAEVEFVIYHGVTDAPAVDVIARDVATLTEGLAYTDVTENYLAVPADAYFLNVNAAGTDVTVASFSADLTGLAGGAAIVLATGFLDSSLNVGGRAFGLIAVLPDGTVVPLEIDTSVENTADIPTEFSLNQNYPNPFNPTTNISYQLPGSSNVRIDVYNIQGQRVSTIVNSQQAAGAYTVSFDASSLASGVYLYRIQATSEDASSSFVQTRKMMLVK